MASDRHDFSRLANRADFVFAKYRRHFAGQNRATRDPALLSDLIAELKRLDTAMVLLHAKNRLPQGERDLDLVRNALELYLREQAEIEKAQSSGNLEHQAGTLSQQANQQFELYRAHFAKQSRATRRPALLERIIGRLRTIHDRMVKVQAAGFDQPFHAKNIGIVEDHLARYTAELSEIQRVREQHGTRQLVPLLGDAANAIFKEYRESYAGKSRNTADPERLSVMCDQLDEIRRQMDDLSDTMDDERNEKNLGIVVGQLKTFQNELQAIREARK